MFLWEKNLWASVPECNDLMSIGFNWHAKGSSKTKISKLNDVTIIANQKVLWLKISVEDPIWMKEYKWLEDLESKTLSLLRWQGWSLLFHILFKIILKVFKNQIELFLGEKYFFESIRNKKLVSLFILYNDHIIEMFK